MGRQQAGDAFRTSYGPSTGMATGIIGLIACAFVIVLTVVTDHSFLAVKVVLGVLVVATLIWCYLLRPRVVLWPDDVELRNALIDFRVPYAGINDVSIRSVTRVYAGPRAVVGIGMGIPTRRLVRPKHGASPGPFGGITSRGTSASAAADRPTDAAAHTTSLDVESLPVYVTEQILSRAQIARARLGEANPPRPVRRVATRELVVLGVLVVAFVVALLVG